MTVIISRKFDVESGSAEWILAEKVYKYSVERTATVKIEQKVKSKVLHDWFIIPLKCLWYRVNGYKDFYFMAENQALFVFMLNMTFANTHVYFYDLMRIQNEKKGIDHLYFSLVYWLASKGKYLLADSTQTALELIEKYGEKIEERITVTPPVMDDFKVNKTNRRYNVIGFLSSLTSRKRPLKVVELAKYIKHNSLAYQIEVWGSGDLYHVLQNSITEEELNNIVILKGHAPEKDKEQIFNSFGYFFFPTEKEGFGLPAYEALSCGVPTFVYEDSIIPMEVKNRCIVIRDEAEMFEQIKHIKYYHES